MVSIFQLQTVCKLPKKYRLKLCIRATNCLLLKWLYSSKKNKYGRNKRFNPQKDMVATLNYL